MAEAQVHDERIVIIGAGQAAIQAAQTLRRKGHMGPLTIIGEESYAPYQRPPLSKAFLKGTMDETALAFKKQDYYSQNQIELVTNVRAREIDRTARKVILDDGTSVAYDRLIIATGTRPRVLPTPGAELSGVLALRGLDDAKVLKDEVGRARKVVVIGGGYIGLEAAAVCRQLGLDVTVIERQDRLLARVTAPEVSDFYRQLHEAEGVRVVLDGDVDRLVGAASGRVRAVHLCDGAEFEADFVLVGIGVYPNEELAREAGLTCQDGVLVNAACRTDDPVIYAIGDCTRQPHPGSDAPKRLESVHNAIQQANMAVADILGQPAPAYEIPWFWSDQFDLKLQTAGLFDGFDQLVIKGDVAARKFTAIYFRKGHMVAVDAIGDAGSFLAAKNLLTMGARVSAEMLSGDISLKDLAKAEKQRRTAAE